jgi:hypothetical protein
MNEPAASASKISSCIRPGSIDKLTPQIRLMLLHADEGEEVEVDHPGHSPNRMLRTPRKKSCYFGNYYFSSIREEVREQLFARILKQNILEQYLLPSWYHILFRFTPF